MLPGASLGPKQVISYHRSYQKADNHGWASKEAERVIVYVHGLRASLPLIFLPQGPQTSLLENYSFGIGTILSPATLFKIQRPQPNKEH